MALHKILLPDGVTELANVKSVTFKEAVNSGVDLRPGCVGSASIEVEVYGAQTNAVSVGDALTYYQIDKGGNQTLIGVFYAEPTIATKNSWKFVAYDAANKLNADFSSWLMSHQASFPMTIKNLVSAACTEAGVTLGSASWTLSTENVNAFYADGITCRQVLSYAAELGCKFVRCHNDGKVYFDWYATVANKRIYPSAGTSGSEKRYAYKQDGLSYSNFSTAGIDGVAVHPSGEDDVAYIYPTTPSGDNLLNITNNLLLTGADAALYNAAAQAVYTALNTLGTYRPATARLFPMENPFRAGDVVAVTDVQGVSFTTVVMEQTVTDSDATLTSTGNEYYADGESNPQKALVQLASDVVRINKLKVSWAEIDQAIITYLTTNNVTAQNLTIVDANDVVLATFNANGITLGQTNQGHMVLDFNSLELYDKNGILYTNIGDLRGADGYFTLTETFVTTEPTSQFNVSFQIASVNSVKIDGVATQAYHAYTYYITTNSPVATGKTVAIEYKTAAQIYRYDFGTRDSGTNVGAFSVVCGAQQSATERYSAAVGGRYNKARGVASLVVGGDSNLAVGSMSSICGGYDNTIPVNADFASICGGYSNRASGAYSFIGGGTANASSGAYSFASNRNNAASGDNSSAIGHGNKARGESQFAFGKYCIEDNNNEFAEVVGNGTADNARSNARTLDWSGNEVLAGGLTVGGDIIRQLPTIALQTNYFGAKFVDENDDSRGGVFYYKSPTYGEGLRLLNSRYISGSQINNGLSMYVDDSGNRYVVVNDQSAWQKGLGMRYVAGDSIAFGTTGDNIYNRFIGDWRYTNHLWFTIPLTKPCDGLTATATGSVYVCSGGSRYTVNLANVTPTCYTTPCGVTVDLAFSSAPSYATQFQPVTVQSYGLTITFS